MPMTPLTHGQLLNMGEAVLNHTGLTIAEGNRARSIRNSNLQHAFMAVAKHLDAASIHQARKIATARTVAELGGYLNDQTALESAARSYSAAVDATPQGLIGGGKGGRAINATKLVTRIHDGVHENHRMNQFFTNDFAEWQLAMAEMYTLGSDSPAFRADFAPFLVGGVVRNSAILDSQAVRIGQLTGRIDDLMGGALFADAPLRVHRVTRTGAAAV